jgi:hypothetical protein
MTIKRLWVGVHSIRREKERERECVCVRERDRERKRNRERMSEERAKIQSERGRKLGIK